MKNRLGIVLFIISFFMVDATVSYVKKEDIKEKKVKEINEIRAVYLSYLEYQNNFSNSVKINQATIDKMIENLYNDHFNTIILHVSPFSDTIYKSKIFPYSYTLTGEEGKNPGFDYLDYFIKKSHLKNIKVYAWINPYRISFSENKELLSKDNPAYKLIDTSSVHTDKRGIYYNPASEIVKDLIIKQVKEIIDNYNVDGIHFDDYFYIQNDVDKEEYNSYVNNGGKLSLKEFRLSNTNDLIKRVYKVIKEKDESILFSIAPDGNINNNYLYHYADVKEWLSSNEYIDIIMPQIYYGFENEYSPFAKVLDNWKALIKNEKIRMVPVLAIYKSGVLDNDSGSGLNEWINHDDLIKRQVLLIRYQNLSGYALFRYDFMYNNSKMNDKSVKEMENLRKLS